LQIANETQLQAIDEKAKQEGLETVKFADESPLPDLTALSAS
jgi:hypothetical protein